MSTSNPDFAFAAGAPLTERIKISTRLKALLPALSAMCEASLRSCGVDQCIDEGTLVLSEIGWKRGVGRAKTLSAQNEILLFKALNAAKLRGADLIKKHPLEPSEGDLQPVFHTLRLAADFEAAIVESNMPLVLAMAKRSRLGDVDFNEMVSEGNLALYRTALKFDWTRGFKFSTYACRGILKAFSRSSLAAARRRARFVQDRPELPPVDEIHTPPREAIEREGSAAPQFLEAGFDLLNENEKKVITERFDLNRRGRKTLEQIGEELGLSKERVRQIQQSALRKMRELASEENWRDKL